MKKILPGTAIKLNDHGILIQGPSNIGKSELALSLIQYGHSLIADDAVELEKTKDGITLNCPEKLQNLLEIRNLGIINIKDLYGDKAICESTPLSLIITLQEAPVEPLDRLKGSYINKVLLDQEIPVLTIGCARERPLDSIVECVGRCLTPANSLPA